LHTEEVQRLWALVKEEIQPRRIFDLALSTIREMSAERFAAILPTSLSSR
jgi:hypothetical protein